MKKLLMIFFAITTIMNAQLDTLFFDDFSDNRKNWGLGSSNGNTMNIEDGNFVWERDQSNGWSTWWTFNQINVDEFSMESRFLIEDGGEFGFIWGGKGSNDAYYFTITEDGEATSWLFSRGNYGVSTAQFEIDNWESHEFNTLKIYKKENRVFYYVNDALILEEYFGGLFGRIFGITLWHESLIKIDYWLVTHRVELIPDLVYTSQPENLGPGVNHAENEIYPIVTPDGKGLYFTRSYWDQNLGGEKDQYDIIYSALSADGKWGEGLNVGRPLNNSGTNTVTAVTPDGNTLLVLNKYDEDGESIGGGISITQRASEGWEIPKEVEIIDYYNLENYYEWTLSSDARTIVVGLRRDDSYGTRDLYVLFKMENGKWSRPLNLGPDINTHSAEFTPFLAPDGKTLYFASEGHPGYGSADVFMARRLDDTWIHWSKPVNLGKPINSEYWDAYYSVPASGEYAYFVSQNTSGYGGGDIYRIKLPEIVKPTPVVLVFGKVLNKKDDQPVQSFISYFDLSTGETVGTAVTNPKNGEYKISLPAGKNYGFLASSESYLSVSENLDLRELEEYKELERNLYLVPIEVGESIRLNNIFFESGKAELLPESFIELDKLVKILEDNGGMKIQINGHTDNVGNDQNNLLLSQRRAAAVVDYLISKGIEAARLDSKGYGETQPVASNDTEEGRALNRRVEFLITEF